MGRAQDQTTDQTKDYNIGICYFFTKTQNSGVRAKTDAQNHDNVSRAKTVMLRITIMYHEQRLMLRITIMYHEQKLMLRITIMYHEQRL